MRRAVVVHQLPTGKLLLLAEIPKIRVNGARAELADRVVRTMDNGAHRRVVTGHQTAPPVHPKPAAERTETVLRKQVTGVEGCLSPIQ
jgi:hypothetical protein